MVLVSLCSAELPSWVMISIVACCTGLSGLLAIVLTLIV